MSETANPQASATIQSLPSAAQAGEASPAPATPQPVEAKTEASLQTTEAPKQDERFASKFAALAKQEKRIAEEKRALKEREARIAQYEKAKELAKSNPEEWLKIGDVSYEDITNYYLTGKPKEEDPGLKALKEVEALKQAQEKAEKLKQESELKAKVDAHIEEQVSFIKANATDYELINNFDVYSLVFDVQNEYYQTHKKVLSNKEAADKVEKYLESEVKKLGSVKKLKNLFEVAPAAKMEPEKVEAPKTPVNKSQTLTNNMAQAQPSPDDNRPYSRETSLEKAARLLRWQ